MKDCDDFLAERHPAFARAALLLTGEPQAAQDLVQEAMIKVVLKWGRVSRAGSPEAYAHRLLVNTFLSGRRRAWHGELPVAAVPDLCAKTETGYERSDDRDRLRRGLAALPPRQRAAVFLRHCEDRSEAETAQLLGCSVGNVKSLTARGVAALRAELSTDSPTAQDARSAPMEGSSAWRTTT